MHIYPDQIIITGSHGKLLVDTHTGDVVQYEPELSYPSTPEDSYANITKFNLLEHQMWWSEMHENQNDTSYDILGFGYWTTDGVYCEPDYTWREMIDGFALEQQEFEGLIESIPELLANEDEVPTPSL